MFFSHTQRWVIFLLTAALIISTHPLLGCAQAPPQGYHAAVATEEAAIIWDSRTHTEHFIRHASFESNAKDFGFLVPTPEAPHLSAVSSDLFKELGETYHPRFIRKPIYGLKLSSIASYLIVTAGADKHLSQSIEPAIQVLETQEVAGYDATVLRADDAGALAHWLQEHGYEARPALTQWLQPYVQNHWAITAFKIAGSTDTSRTASATVDMSFRTPQPFFPYSEPADQREPGAYSTNRLLRVYLMSDVRMDAKLNSQEATWPGKVSWATVLRSGASAAPVGNYQSRIDQNTSDIPGPLWLTAFEDKSSPRPGVADVVFSHAKSQEAVKPTPSDWPRDKRIGVPFEFLIVGAFLCIRAGRRRKIRAQAA